MTINSIRIGQSRYRQFRSFCSARYDSATEALAIHGDGHRIPNQSDAFQYVYKPLSGDGEITKHPVPLRPKCQSLQGVPIVIRNTQIQSPVVFGITNFDENSNRHKRKPSRPATDSSKRLNIRQHPPNCFANAHGRYCQHNPH